MNRTILLLIFLFLFLAACQSPTPTAFLQPSPSPTPTPTPNSTGTPIPSSATLEPFQATMQANQTQNAIYNATVGVKSTATRIALLTQAVITPSVTPTHTPTPTASPIPTLTAHTWTPETVLIFWNILGGDRMTLLPSPPSFVLFADGQLLISQGIQVGDDYRLQILHKKLERREVCALLNTIDQTGFFGYDPSTYLLDRNGKLQNGLAIDGAGTSQYTVNACQKQDVSLYALGAFMYSGRYHPICTDECSGVPTVLPSLANFYWLLKNFDTTDMQIFQPVRIALWVNQSLYETSGESWPFPSVKLADMYANGVNEDGTLKPNIIGGPIAQDMFALYNQMIYPYGTYFIENGIAYEVVAIPDYPYPWDTEEKYPGIPDTLTCTPEDGVLEIPTGE